MRSVGKSRKTAPILFTAVLILILLLLGFSMLKTRAYNSVRHRAAFCGSGPLFRGGSGGKGCVHPGRSPGQHLGKGLRPAG